MRDHTLARQSAQSYMSWKSHCSMLHHPRDAGQTVDAGLVMCAKPKGSICLLCKQADTAFWLCRAVCVCVSVVIPRVGQQLQSLLGLLIDSLVYSLLSLALSSQRWLYVFCRHSHIAGGLLPEWAMLHRAIGSVSPRAPRPLPQAATCPL